MNRRLRFRVLLWPYLALVVGAGFLHHHDMAPQLSARSGSVMVASGDSECLACQWLLSSAGVFTDVEAPAAQTTIHVLCAASPDSCPARIELPPSRAPPSV
jgi:hypothetical protein